MSNIDLTTAFRLHAAAKEATREATIAESSALDLVVKAAGSKTFSYEGQLYQVRSRYNKELGITLNFICALKLNGLLSFFYGLLLLVGYDTLSLIHI